MPVVATEIVVFPAGLETEADAYLAFVNANSPEAPDPVYDQKWDMHGQRVVLYLGPTGFIWNGEPFPEPEGGPALRAAGALVTGVTWEAPEEWPEDPPIEEG